MYRVNAQKSLPLFHEEGHERVERVNPKLLALRSNYASLTGSET